MSTRRLGWVSLLLGAGLVIALVMWGWRQGGLALLQLGMSLC